jgi:uncharacterized membrane protein (DUF441 family)
MIERRPAETLSLVVGAILGVLMLLGRIPPDPAWSTGVIALVASTAALVTRFVEWRRTRPKTPA